MLAPPLTDQVRSWLVTQATRDLTAVVESLTGTSVSVSATWSESLPDLELRVYEIALSETEQAFIATHPDTWNELARRVVGDLESEFDSTAQELAQQYLASLVKSFHKETGDTSASAPDALISAATLTVPALEVDLGENLSVWISISDGAQQKLQTELTEQEDEPFLPPPPPIRTTEVKGNIDLLLDVELPITISFGRANLPLKDVMKLSAGSIVELNRNVSEPVEIVVNDCVVARGEVVVVEGNYGVRVTQIVSRQERLKTIR
jgi:flagellar motor switch protein FliN